MGVAWRTKACSPFLLWLALSSNRASLVAQTVNSLPAVWETWVQVLGWEDPPEEGMATHSCILAWRIPWIEQPGRLQSMGSQKWGMTEHSCQQLLNLKL